LIGDQKGFVFVEEEFFTYLSIFLAMCLCPRPAFEDYWKKDPLLSNSFIFNRMTKKRWLEIHFWLHFDVITVEARVSLSLLHEMN